MADHPKSFLLDAPLHHYLVEHMPPLDDVARDLIEETAALGDVARMQVAPEQAAFMTMLTRIVRAHQAVEVGTFTGLSSLAIAHGLSAGGRLLCCDVSEEWTAIARRAWERAGVADRIDLRIGPAADTLAALPRHEYLDLAFIDADKGGYPRYYEEIVARLRPNGVILCDNTLWSGSVVDPSRDDEQVRQIRAFNDMVAADGRVDSVLLPISDGLTLVRKRD